MSKHISIIDTGRSKLSSAVDTAELVKNLILYMIQRHDSVVSSTPMYESKLSSVIDTAESELSAINNTAESNSAVSLIHSGVRKNTAESILETFKGSHFIYRETQAKFKQG
jgi:hypothetical protein